MTGAMTGLGATRLRAGVLTRSSALFGALVLAAMNAPAVAQLMAHFGVSYGDALWIIGLVSAGSIVLFWVFPYLIPFIGTIRLLMIYFGAGVVIGW
ncbi:MAG TPA: hypothetical protein VGG90_11725 [Candidatus Dormibacteraeota bacterium]|jgi:hypothetical protein